MSESYMSKFCEKALAHIDDVHQIEKDYRRAGLTTAASAINRKNALFIRAVRELMDGHDEFLTKVSKVL